ncbi:MAG TPA: TrbG/VirB9 family P-type conjugative transfer protein [Asticcacaulis sp.]|nr:TrbG/VirB9 family P-type conjugative transfer protein [Asticcacaulis sp.]
MLYSLIFLTSAAVSTPPTPLTAPPTSPAHASHDPRIRDIAYTPQSVISVPVSRGVVTRIVLEPGEKIIAAATGEPSKCDDDAHKWCVVADADANEIWVKPKLGATHNNLELKTDRRDYSFDFTVGNVTTYRVVLRYPAQQNASEGQGDKNAQLVSERMKDARPVPRNLNYTLQSNHRGADIKPAAVFDDGAATYFSFPGNVELPTIFAIGSDGKEARANYNMQGDYMVVQTLAHQFVLRLGKSVVSVWNEAFDPKGVAPVGETRVPGVARDVVGGS